jgi:hypothetical protein
VSKPIPLSAARVAELLGALDSGDKASYIAGFEIGDEDDDVHHDTQLERGELRELLNHYAAQLGPAVESSPQPAGPQLGLATTLELIDELAARAAVADAIGECWPTYRTVGGDAESALPATAGAATQAEHEP